MSVSSVLARRSASEPPPEARAIVEHTLRHRRSCR
jgi:hypothetical protein